MSAPRETDALLRLLRGYGRVYDDPPDQQHITKDQCRLKVGYLMASTLRDLDERLKAGESAPEAWVEAWGAALLELDGP